MYLVVQLDSCHELVKIWKTSNKEEAERFIEFKRKEEGIYGEHDYYLEPLTTLDDVPSISSEEYEKVVEQFNIAFEDHKKRMEKIDRERQEMGKALNELFVNCCGRDYNKFKDLFKSEEKGE